MVLPDLLSASGREAVARAVGGEVALDEIPARPPRSAHAVPHDSATARDCPDEALGLEYGDRTADCVAVSVKLAGQVLHPREVGPWLVHALHDASSQLSGDIEIPGMRPVHGALPSFTQDNIDWH